MRSTFCFVAPLAAILVGGVAVLGIDPHVARPDPLRMEGGAIAVLRAQTPAIADYHAYAINDLDPFRPHTLRSLPRAPWSPAPPVASLGNTPTQPAPTQQPPAPSVATPIWVPPALTPDAGLSLPRGAIIAETATVVVSPNAQPTAVDAAGVVTIDDGKGFTLRQPIALPSGR